MLRADLALDSRELGWGPGWLLAALVILWFWEGRGGVAAAEGPCATTDVTDGGLMG